MIRRRLLSVALAALVGPILFQGCGPSETVRTVTVDTGEISRPTVAVSSDESGSDVYWAWIRRDSDGWNTYVSRLDPASDKPSAPVRVNHEPGNASPHAQAPAQVAVRPDGGIVVAWTNRIDVEDRRFPASDLLVSVSEDGGRTFTRERAVHSDAGGPPTGHTFHDLAVLPDGAVLISWIDGRVRDAARRRSAGSGSTAQRPSGSELTAATGHADHAPTGRNAPGRPGHEPGSEIRVARSDDGGHTFRETAIVDTQSCPCCRTALAVSPGGDVYLAWRHEFDNGDRDIVVASSTDGGQSFSDPVRVHRDGWNIEACPHAGPAIASTENDELEIVWYTGADSGPGLYSASSRDGGRSFGDRKPVITDIPVRHATLDAGRLSHESAAYGTIEFADEKDASSASGRLPDIDVRDEVAAWAWQTDSAIMGRVVRHQ